MGKLYEINDFNPLHTHGGDYSFVLFLDVPEKLVQEQEDFEGKLQQTMKCWMFEYTQQVKIPRWDILRQ